MTDGNDLEMRTTDLRTGQTQQLHFGQRIGRFAQDIPRSRWLLFAGSLLAVSLVFWPWFTVTWTCISSISFGCPLPSFQFGINPLGATLNGILAEHASLVRFVPFRIVLLLGACAPGLLCSMWVRGRLPTRSQWFGAIVFSFWLVLLAGWCLYAIFWVLSSDYARAHFPSTPHNSITWQPAIGLLFLVMTLALLWIGLLLLWRELLHSQVVSQARSLQRQTPLAYLGAAMTTGGSIAWFIGFYGIYWLLPVGCPPTPIFASAPCNNRFSSNIGYAWLFQSGQSNFTFTQDLLNYSYWLLGAVIVAGGVVLLVAFWLRQTENAQRPWILGWGACLALLTVASWWGTRYLFPIYPDEQWTNGPLIAFTGLLLIAAGVVLRWRAVVAQFA